MSQKFLEQGIGRIIQHDKTGINGCAGIGAIGYLCLLYKSDAADDDTIV